MSADLATALDPSRLNEPAWHPANHVEETKVLPNLTEQMPTVAPVEEIVTKPEKEAEEKPVPSKKKAKDQQKPKSKKKLLFLGIAAVLVIGIATIAFSVLGGGKNEISVPDVSNLSESAARSKLQEAGLKAAGQTEEITSDKIPEGKVVKTNPEAKNRYTYREVVLYISTGGRKIKMKDYTDMEYNEAVEALVKLDFKESKIKKKEEYSDTVEKGKISHKRLKRTVK